MRKANPPIRQSANPPIRQFANPAVITAHSWRSKCEKKIVLLLSVAALIHAGALVCAAQTAQITGRVSDPSDAVLPDADITVTNVDTGIETITSTNDAGYYNAALLPPGTYRIVAEKEGFRPLTRLGVTLNVDQTHRVDLILQLGVVTEIITVTEDAPVIQANNAESSSVIETKEYDNLPLVQNGRMRNPAWFIYLSPRIHGDVRRDGRDNTSATNRTRIGGGQTHDTEVLVEGIVAGRTESTGSFTEVAPPVDAIREFKVTTSLMSAEYGRSGLGVISFMLKSGTNQFHGSLYDYLRNDQLDARQWTAKERTVTRQNEFGVSVGGPVRLGNLYDGRDRTFFFFAYAGSRKRGATNIESVQIATQANVGGDFPDLVNKDGGRRLIYDPATTRLNAQGAFERDPFPDNRIPGSRIDPVAAEVAALLPAPNQSGSGLNLQGPTGEQQLDPDVFVYKVDHAFSSAHRITGSYNTTDIPRLRANTPLPFPLIGSTDQQINGYTARFSYDYVISPAVLNQLSLGYDLFDHDLLSWSDGNSRKNPEGINFPNAIGLRGVAGGSAFPRFNFTDGLERLGDSRGTGDDEVVWVLKDALSWFRGSHSLKFGIEYRSYQPHIRRTNDTSGRFDFNRLETAFPGRGSTSGYSFASMLLGAVHSGELRFPAVRRPRGRYFGSYVQDDYKLTPKLTLNLGLRFEFNQAPYEAEDIGSAIDLSLPNPGAGGLPGGVVFMGSGPGRTGSRSVVDTDYTGWGPRFGLAYQLTPDTVLRAGYGIYYSHNNLTLPTAAFNISARFQSLDNGITPAFYLNDGFPQDFRKEPAIDPSFLNGQNATVVEDSSAALPRTQNWTFSLQRSVFRDSMLEALYTGAHGTRLTAERLVTLNQVHPRHLALGSLLTKSVFSEEARGAGIPVPFEGFEGSVAQALRPFPQFLDLTSARAKAGSSSYHGLTLRFRKRMSSGLGLDSHYTFSKALGYTTAPNTSDAIGQDNYNRRLEYSLLPLDLRHALVLQYTYELPFGPGKRFPGRGGVLGKLVGGWAVSGIHRYQSGAPILLRTSNTLPLFNRELRPDVAPGAKLTSGISNGDFSPQSDRRINTAAFSDPQPFSFGTSAPTYTDLRNFPTFSESFALIKTTSLSERTSLETYAQFFNAFNRHRFARFQNQFTSSSFGKARAVSLPRFIQLGLRIRF